MGGTVRALIQLGAKTRTGPPMHPHPKKKRALKRKMPTSGKILFIPKIKPH